VGIWSFYLLTDLITTVMVATFWAYATDLSNADQAKRLFGFIGAGGLLGGVAGTFVAKSLGGDIGAGGALLVAAVLMAIVAVITRVTHIAAARSGLYTVDPVSVGSGQSLPPKPDESHAALEGAKLVLRSKYLLSIVGILAFYEMASQIMDFQFSKIGEQFDEVASVQAFFADVRLYANIVSVAVQLLLVSVFMRKLGVLAALLVLPLCAIGSSLGFLVLGTVQAASLLHISDNGLNYSIQQTSRESLYTITTPGEKYKARAFTNMFMQRFAKGVSVLTSMGLLALGVDIQHMSWLTIAAALGMIVCSIYAGHRFAGGAEDRATPKPAVSLA
jgi:AAA family ATP:ADP antiporter